MSKKGRIRLGKMSAIQSNPIQASRWIAGSDHMTWEIRHVTWPVCWIGIWRRASFRDRDWLRHVAWKGKHALRSYQLLLTIFLPRQPPSCPSLSLHYKTRSIWHLDLDLSSLSLLLLFTYSFLSLYDTTLANPPIIALYC